MSAESEALLAAVGRNKTVDGSLIELTTGLVQQLKDMANSATDLATLKSEVLAAATQLEADNQAVADFVIANTPSDTPEAMKRRSHR